MEMQTVGLLRRLQGLKGVELENEINYKFILFC